MRSTIESESGRIGAMLVNSNLQGTPAVQFSTSAGTDTHQGRLWTEAAAPTHYELLCWAVKKGAVYDRESGLWVKRASQAAFDAYRAERQPSWSRAIGSMPSRFLAPESARTMTLDTAPQRTGFRLSLSLGSLEGDFAVTA